MFLISTNSINRGIVMAFESTISGKFSGYYGIVIRSTQTGDDGEQLGKVQACSGPRSDDPIALLEWEFDFTDPTNLTVTLQDGRLTPKPGAPAPAPWVDYIARSHVDSNSPVLQVVLADNGLYVVKYFWQILPGGNEGPSTDKATINLEITQLQDDSIVVVTHATGSIPGTPLPGFPLGATPDWRGRAKKVG